MMCNFHVGQKVVCVSVAANAKEHEQWNAFHGYTVKFPQIGSVYTIRNISSSCGQPMLRFTELVNPVLPYANGPSEIRFGARHFRPLVERKTDISVFTAMLDTSKERAPA